MQNKLRNKLNFNYESFIDSRNYLFKHCRKLEQVRFSCLFENLNQDSLLEQITTYQNNDGGFGHGLEPDLRTRYSSSLCTTVALQILNDMNAIKKHKIIKKAIVYLENTFNQKLNHGVLFLKKHSLIPMHHGGIRSIMKKNIPLIILTLLLKSYPILLIIINRDTLNS